MVGIPKTLNSKYDYLYIKAVWKNMWEQRKHWMPAGILANKEDGIEDETHRIVEMNQSDFNGEEQIETTTWQQEEYIDDPMSDFFLYGFTEQEVKDALGIK